MTFWVRNILFLTAFVVLVLAEILLSLTNLNALVAQQARTIIGYETKDEVQRLRIAADGILTSTRSYVLQEDAGYKQAFAQAKEQIGKSLQQLNILMADEPSQRQRLAEIEGLIPSFLGNFEKIMLLYDKSGPQAAISQLRLREDTLLAGRLNELILQLDGEQGRLLRDRVVVGLPDGSGSDLLPLLSFGTPAVIFAAVDPPENLTRQVAASLVKTRVEPALSVDDPPGSRGFGAPQASAAEGGMTTPVGSGASMSKSRRDAIRGRRPAAG